MWATKLKNRRVGVDKRGDTYVIMFKKLLHRSDGTIEGVREAYIRRREPIQVVQIPMSEEAFLALTECCIKQFEEAYGVRVMVKYPKVPTPPPTRIIKEGSDTPE